MISQYNIGKQGAVGEYNANNAWLYYGNNGNINNNNKYGSYGVRPVLESHNVKENFVNLMVPLDEWYRLYRICKKNCSGKYLHLRFRYGWFVVRMINICYNVNEFEYVPMMSICFMIELPRLREVIAALFDDKMVQTLYCDKIMPLLEKNFLDPDSYACRKGKGGLRAVINLQEYIFEESDGYTADVWLAKVDIKGFFMSIDTEIGVRLLGDFINKYVPDARMRNLLLYLTRIIYQSMPQMHCIMQSPKEVHESLPEYKRMKGKLGYKGVAIGNKTSQMIAAFYTTFYLQLLRSMGYRFVHYTDDTAIVVRDKDKWLADRRYIAAWMEKELRLTLHPKKVYLQHYSKGIELLGYKLRFNRRLPSDRIVHNFRWKVAFMSRKAESDPYLYANLEHFMQTVNSYLGLLGWCNTARLRHEVLETIKAGPYGKAFLFSDDDHKINIKPSYTRIAHYVRKNKQRKKSLNLWVM